MISQIFWKIFLSHGLRWFLFLLVMCLNFVAYYQDPTRYTTEPACLFSTPCKWFDYGTGMITYTIDVLTFIGLWFTIAPEQLRWWMPDYWYIPIIILGYAVITQITIDSPNIKDNKDILASPPSWIWPHKWRIILYSSILLIDIIIFFQLYVDSGMHNYDTKTKVFDVIIKSRFGGWNEGNYTQFMFAWLGIFGVLADCLALYYVYSFNSCQYKLPISWNF
jgi:hypothetical protein